MLRWTLGCTCLFQIWFPQCVCPEVLVDFLMMTTLTAVVPHSFDLHFSNNSDVEHLFMCLLSICISASEKCLFRSPAHFWLGCLFSWYWASWVIYKFWRLIPCQSHCLQIFSPIFPQWVILISVPLYGYYWLYLKRWGNINTF